MSNELEKLHIIAFDLRNLGMLQTAGDIDYLVSWLRSPEFNNGEHLGPHPAGKNTIDPYSNNCPIPFTASAETIKQCKSRLSVGVILSEAKDILISLKTTYNSDIETVALDSYIEYVTTVKSILDEAEWQEWVNIFPEFGEVNCDIKNWLNWDHYPFEI